MSAARVLTNEHVDAIRCTLHRAYHDAFDACPGDERIATAWAHVVHEHGWDPATGETTGLWGNNVGNRDAPRGSPGTFATVPERENIGGHEVRRVHVRQAFATLAEGTLAYWRGLAFRFPLSLTAMAIGPVATATALKVERYYTGSLIEYTRALRRHRATYDKRYGRDAFDVFCGWTDGP